MTALIIVVSLAAVAALFVTTGAGKRLWKRAGMREIEGRASNEDQDFLLDALKGDVAAVQERIERERQRFPDLTEHELYRRAIRTWFQEKE